MNIINSGIYIEDGGLSDYAASAAKLLAPEGFAPGVSCIGQLKYSYGRIKHTHEALGRFARLPSPPAACQWLLDNWYMIQREYNVARADIRAASRLRMCEDGVLIIRLCHSLIRSGLGQVTKERCMLFLEGFQTVTVLTREELYLFPAAIRAALIGEIALVCRELEYSADTEEHAKALGTLISSLRLFSVLDTDTLLTDADITGRILSGDPTGDYSRLDSATRQDYLRQIERLSRRAGVEEHILAQRIVRKAVSDKRHVGFYLFNEGRGGGLYIAANLIISIFIALLAGISAGSGVGALLLLFPVSELVKSLMDFLLLRFVPPTHLPRLDTQSGVPIEGKTLCVVSVLLSGAQAADKIYARLEELYYACRSEGENLSFGILADLPASDSESCESDREIIQRAQAAISSLNRKYGSRFYLFTRERRFDGEKYTGFERKRGALLALARLLCDKESELKVTGERDALSGTRYILTLDSDTRIYPGAVGELIGAALHPLNRPVIDDAAKAVRSGHAVIHPRIDCELESACETDFALIFSGSGGCDPYGSLCGELYMDCFGSGGFAGKGLIDASALLSCTDGRFPEGRILSHDALEGAYLRGAYMGDTEFCDRFPTRPLAYYRRLHRWVRGDWQNSPWIFKKELPAIERWRLFDSLRRSLIAPFTLFAIIAGFFLPERGLLVAAWAALLALLSTLFLTFASRGFARREHVRLRRYTRVLGGIGGAIIQTFIRLWLLPYEAWICLSAACSSLWRMLVTHRRLLQWETAAQSEGMSSGFFAHLRAMWLPALLGLSLLFLSPVIIGRSAGLMWLLSPAAAFALALPAAKPQALTQEDVEYLTSAAAKSWKYLSEFSSPEDNHLPPDNFQEQPPVGVAHRTSPTNIGLAMVSAIAVCDMRIITHDEAASYICAITDTLERLPRCMGHFYNWYDTRTLQPLTPAFISTVDSGNMYASLLTVRQALRESGSSELCARIDAIMADMDFSPLYDSVRGLFYICWDSENARGAGGWYDLMASEAMLTSYLAIAKGDVPKKHWRRLSRAQLQKDGFRGLASWTGTMFEYLMPELFLPFYRGSLLNESGRFCLYAQKRRVSAGLPWGISESAFFSFDSALNYRYKANGVQALALKRGQDDDTVISPYSSFLALAVEPRSASANLRRLESFGAVGRCGFIEALDFTPGRSRRDDGERVRCYMAHHVGMSIIAAANAVCSGSIRSRFMSDGAIRAFSLLLQESLPADGTVIRRDMTEVPEKPERSGSERWQTRGTGEDAKEQCCVFSSGAYNIMSTVRGETAATLGTTTVYRSLAFFAGSIASLSGAFTRLLPSSEPQLWEFSEDGCRFSVISDDIEYDFSCCTAGGDCGELRAVSLLSKQDRRLELELSFTPILAPLLDYVNHSAYWRLGIFSEAEGNMLLLRRLKRAGQKELWLCLVCDSEAAFSADANGGIGWLSHPLVKCRTSVSLHAGERRTVRFAICAASEQWEAVRGARRILDLSAGEEGNMVSAAASLLRLSAPDTGFAMELLGAIANNRRMEACPKSALWQFGISGDLPIISCDGAAPESERLLMCFCLLKSCGVNADLVFLTGEGGEYYRPVQRKISEALSRVGLESLIGARGGVHFAPKSAADTVRSRACYLSGEKLPLLPPAPEYCLSGQRALSCVPKHHWNEDAFEYYVNLSLPSRAWQHILTNGSFGYIATDSSIGGMWYKNAREMPINLPAGDITDVTGTEALFAYREGRRISLFAANDDYPCKVSFRPGCCSWEKDIDGKIVAVHAFVPMGIDARVLVISGAKGMRLHWQLRPVMGSEPECIELGIEGNTLFCRNSAAYYPDAVFRVSFSSKAELECGYSSPCMDSEFIADDESVIICGCASAEELSILCKPSAARAAMAYVKRVQAELSESLHLECGCSALEHYMNSWAIYQTAACRLEGRSSLYQSGGAFGFRDQLQDAVNLLLVTPGYAEERIIDCCRHQYLEGDVMHWWHVHPSGDRGVRTRCADDMLWLVWALCEYTQRTGNYDICSIEINYVNSPVLQDSEADRYETPELSDVKADVLEHARLALERCISNGFGAHGLPLFGSGDWNDGLSSVNGESEWLAWFFSCCADGFAALLDKLCKPGTERYRDYALKVGRAADAVFEYGRYPRGFLADGSPLGGEDMLDSVSQSWAAFCKHSTHARQGVLQAFERLVDRKNRLVKLFDPPFAASGQQVGYIVSYGEGFRENGGQYTHGAVWLAAACLKLGLADEGFELLRMLLPEGHELHRYQAEPFVLAADVYSAPGHEGEAGWSWYTGSSGWYFRVVTEELLGIKMREGALVIEPELPRALPAYRARLRGRAVCADISVENGEITVNNAPYQGESIN